MLLQLPYKPLSHIKLDFLHIIHELEVADYAVVRRRLVGWGFFEEELCHGMLAIILYVDP